MGRRQCALAPAAISLEATAHNANCRVPRSMKLGPWGAPGIASILSENTGRRRAQEDTRPSPRYLPDKNPISSARLPLLREAAPIRVCKLISLPPRVVSEFVGKSLFREKASISHVPATLPAGQGPRPLSRDIPHAHSRESERATATVRTGESVNGAAPRALARQLLLCPLVV